MNTTVKTSKAKGRYKAKKYGEFALSQSRRFRHVYRGRIQSELRAEVIEFCGSLFRRRFGVKSDDVIVKVYHEKHNQDK